MYDLILLTAEAPDLAVFPWIAAAIFMQTATSLFTAKKARKQQKKA
jgi:hypothetical protein